MSLLNEQIEAVAKRFRQIDLWRNVSILSGFLALTGLALLVMQVTAMWMHPLSGWLLLGAGLFGIVVAAITAFFSYRDEMVVAEQIENRFPELDHRLITTLDELDRNDGRPLNYLQHSLFQEALTHSYHNPWWRTVSPRIISAFRGRGLAAVCLLMASAIGLMKFVPPAGAFTASVREKKSPIVASDRANFEIQIEPGDHEVEKGSNLIVTARFGKHVPRKAELVASMGDEEMRIPMSRSLEDPIFGGTVSEIQKPFEYHVVYGAQKSETYNVTVFVMPQLVRADALLEYPSYTELPSKRIEDTRRVSAVEGSRVTWNIHVNKPGITAELIPNSDVPAAEPVPLQLDANDPLNHLVSFDLNESVSWKLKLTDAEGRENRVKPTLRAKVIPNRPPALKLELARDASVSPLEEFLVKATVSDDYGLSRFGLNYTLASAAPKDVILGESTARREKVEANHQLNFEELEAEPDQLLSYYFWAEDSDGQGNVRRTLSDMYFAEVRHFEEIFRQGQQQPGGQQQQQQPQQQGQQSANESDAEQLAELQKQIVNATWNLIRREFRATVTPQFEDDISVIIESQQAASSQLQELMKNLEDGESQRHAMDVQTHMQANLRELMKAFEESKAAPLTPAMQAGRDAYQALLKLRAREHEVVQQQQQQGQQQQQRSASQQRMQQQMQQLELQNDQNRYETEQQAQEEEDEAQREMRQVLNRLRELAQRQEDLNKQLKELQNALEEAETEEEKEEIERQLKRLRDQQQELLRDADELMERMDENQSEEALQETREQLEETREQMRDAAESLEKGEVTPALASGTRAQRQLDEMKEELRRESANQFEEQMRDMRNRAQELETRQQEIGEQMGAEAEQAENGTGLRQEPTESEEKFGDALREQNQKLNDLLQEIEETVREAEETEPLLAENLYEAFRDVQQQQVPEQLDRAAELSDRGLNDPANELEASAREGISEFRETIDRAAESVLGDGRDALRKAERMLEDIERQLDSEIRRFGGEPEPGNEDGQEQQPGQGEQGDEPREGESQEGERQEGERQQGEQEGGDRSRQEDQDQREGERSGEDSRQSQDQEQREPQDGRGSQEGQQQEGQQGQGGQGQPQDGQPQDGQQQEGQQQEGQQQEGQQQGQGGGGGDQPQSDQQRDSQSRSQSDQPREGERQRGQLRPGQDRPGLRQPNDSQRRDGGGIGGAWEQLDMAPITGDDFRDWSDQLRDVEEIVDDPELRAEAARIREQARSFRREFKRHSEEPKWNLIKELVSRPLAELRQEVSAELLRRSAIKNALVPIDRDPVPEQFTEQVRKYYENLGIGE